MNALIIGMYVAEMLDKWTKIAVFTIWLGGIASVILFIAKLFIIDILQEAQHIAKSLTRLTRVAIIVTLIAGIFYAIFPKKEVIYIAMGAKVGEYAITEIAKSSKLQKISDIIELKLDEILESYTKDK